MALVLTHFTTAMLEFNESTSALYALILLIFLRCERSIRSTEDLKRELKKLADAAREADKEQR